MTGLEESSLEFITTICISLQQKLFTYITLIKNKKEQNNFFFTTNHFFTFFCWKNCNKNVMK